ncbi:MAG TPA: hypothetical protein ENH90_02175 [bacterium]|nr:hypothetical protein [bacterium]
MWWLIIVILAHLLYALVFITDKYILSRPLPHPIVYAFYVGVLSIVILLLVPFGFYFPSRLELGFILLAGIAQVAGWVFFYKALSKGEVSRIIPFVGGFIAIFVLILSKFFLKEHLAIQQLIAFALLVLGGLTLSFKKQGFLQKHFGLAFVGALCFAIFWVITKYIFLDAPFITGLVWLRTGVALIALTLLIPKRNRQLIFGKTEKIKAGTIKTFFSARFLGLLAGLLMYLAVFWGSVTLANSLQGLQYVFVLILAYLLFKKFPKVREQFGKKIIIQKVIAIVLIGLGLFFLVI